MCLRCCNSLRLIWEKYCLFFRRWIACWSSFRNQTPSKKRTSGIFLSWASKSFVVSLGNRPSSRLWISLTVRGNWKILEYAKVPRIDNLRERVCTRVWYHENALVLGSCWGTGCSNHPKLLKHLVHTCLDRQSTRLHIPLTRVDRIQIVLDDAVVDTIIMGVRI